MTKPSDMDMNMKVDGVDDSGASGKLIVDLFSEKLKSPNDFYAIIVPDLVYSQTCSNPLM